MSLMLICQQVQEPTVPAVLSMPGVPVWLNLGWVVPPSHVLSWIAPSTLVAHILLGIPHVSLYERMVDYNSRKFEDPGQMVYYNAAVQCLYPTMFVPCNVRTMQCWYTSMFIPHHVHTPPCPYPPCSYSTISLPGHVRTLSCL